MGFDLDLDTIKQRQTETTRRDGGGNFFKPKDGKNIIRIFGFQHKVTPSDVKNGYFSKDKLGKTLGVIDRPVVRHFNISKDGQPVLSNPSLMEQYHTLKRKDPEAAKKIKPTDTYFMNVYDVNNPDAGLVLYGAPASVYNKMLTYLADDEYGQDMLGAKGRDFVLFYDKNKNGSDKYQLAPRKEGLSEELSDDMQETAMDLFTDEALAQMGKTIGDNSSSEVAEEPEEEEEAPPKKAAPKAAASSIEDEVEEIFGKKNGKSGDEEVDLSQDPDLEPAPKKKKK